MLFEQRFLAGISDGSVNLAFRRWERVHALPGAVHRTPAGRIVIGSVELVAPEDISSGDARRAGYRTAAELLADLRGDAARPVYRVSFRLVQEPDPRAALAAADRLTADDLAGIRRRLERMDRASATGPWAWQTLGAIEQRPGVRSAELAVAAGRDPVMFKRDVRKLKELGLTESLRVGYRLSLRGRAFLAHGEAAG